MVLAGIGCLVKRANSGEFMRARSLIARAVDRDEMIAEAQNQLRRGFTGWVPKNLYQDDLSICSEKGVLNYQDGLHDAMRPRSPPLYDLHQDWNLRLTEVASCRLSNIRPQARSFVDCTKRADCSAYSSACADEPMVPH